mgnify:CR=1 FL=1
MPFNLFGNFGKYSLLQHGHTVFVPTYCVVCVIIFIVIKSFLTSSFSFVLQPHVHVATFDTRTVSSGFLLTVGAEYL